HNRRCLALVERAPQAFDWPGWVTLQCSVSNPLTLLSCGRMPPMRDHIFISYSREDRPWLERLSPFLQPLKRTHVIWDDTGIAPADRWRGAIQQELDLARLAIWLVSAHFFACVFISEIEL